MSAPKGILFDLIGAQVEPGLPWNGGSEYVKSLFRAFVERRGSVGLFVLLSKGGMLEEGFEAFLKEQVPAERILWIEEFPDLVSVASRHGIGTVFLGILQRFAQNPQFFQAPSPDLDVVCVIHDLVEFELEPTRRSILYERCRSLRDRLWVLRLRLAFPWISRRLARKRQEATTRLVDALRKGFKTEFVAVSEYTRFSIQRHLGLPPSEVRVFWPPASPNQIRLAESACEPPPTGDAVFAMLGADRWSKNLDVVLEAGAILQGMGMRFKVVLVGNFEHRLIRHELANLPWIEVRSHIGSDAVARLMVESTALLFPTRCEGFGYPPTEAMLMGRRVIASLSSSVPEVLGLAGMYFAPDSGAMLAYLMRQTMVSGEHPARELDPRRRADEILQRQERDLGGLVGFIGGDRE